MKKLSLNGREISLLSKVADSGEWPFYQSAQDILVENEDLPEEESIELKLYDENEFDDISEMVAGYLADDSLPEGKMPTDKERIELQQLVEKLEAVSSEED